MASDFADQFTESAWPENLERFGESATYSPKGAAIGTPPIQVSAVIDQTNVEPFYDDESRGEVLSAFFEVSTADVPDPQIGDSVSFDGKTWTVQARDPSDGSGYTRLRVVSAQQDVVAGGVKPIVRG